MEQHSDIGTTLDLALYRIETAKSDLKSARILFDASQLKAANNRAYYAIYHAISAIHAYDGKVYKSHKEAIGNFNRDYVKNEIFPKELGHRIAMAEEIRHASDYDDFYLATLDETKEQIDTADEFIALVEKYIKDNCK